MTASLDVGRLRVDLARRSGEAEWLDRADADPAQLPAYFRDLARFNRAMLGHRPVISFLRRAAKDAPIGEPLTLIDVGCGYGDLLRAVRRWSRKRGLPLRLVGLDVSAETIRLARAATEDADAIDYHVADVFAFQPPLAVDFAVSSLLTHHLSDGRIVDLLRWMDSTARRGWLICDLQRSAAPYLFIGLAGKLARLHPMVIHDGRISFTRSLTRAEWGERIAAAGLAGRGLRLNWFLYRLVIARLR